MLSYWKWSKHCLDDDFLREASKKLTNKIYKVEICALSDYLNSRQEIIWEAFILLISVFICSTKWFYISPLTFLRVHGKYLVQQLFEFCFDHKCQLISMRYYHSNHEIPFAGLFLLSVLHVPVCFFVPCCCTFAVYIPEITWPIKQRGPHYKTVASACLRSKEGK